MKYELRESDTKRFWSKVVKGPGCWKWLGAFFAKTHRPAFWLGQNNTLAYRVSYCLCRGEIPDGKQLDHICNDPGCVNPYHLKPATNWENVSRTNAITVVNSRKLTCKRGHPLSSARGKLAKIHGWRECKVCYLHAQKLRREARRLLLMRET